MGDFQGQLQDSSFMYEAASSGWHAQGQYLRRLDEILASPNLVSSIVGADQKQCGGFSAHALLTALMPSSLLPSP